MELVKVSDGDGVAGYEAVRRVIGKPVVNRDDDGNVTALIEEKPEFRLPDIPEVIDGKLLSQIVKEAPGQLVWLSVSVETGIRVGVVVKPAAPCASCSQPIEPDSAFCRFCGAKVQEAK